MKNNAQLLLLVLSIVFISCKDDKNLKNTTSELPSEMKATHQSEAGQVKAGNFKTYTGEELNDWLPNTILDYVKEPSTLEFGNDELHQIKADYQYKSGHEKYITVEITNGRSSQDLRIMNSIVQRIEMNFAEDTEEGYTKVYKRNNIEVFEMQSNYNNGSSLEYIVNMQFYVRMDGSNVNAEELWQFADQLDFKSLMNK